MDLIILDNGEEKISQEKISDYPEILLDHFTTLFGTNF